jgi:hypothetical protein
MKITSHLENFPKHAALIGRLLVGYVDLEFELLNCLALALPGKRPVQTGIRLLYRMRSESGRINVADAILRPHFTGLNLLARYLTATEALRHCTKIRNQYAHCHWIERNNDLWFSNLDDTAQSTEENSQVELRLIDPDLLVKQEKFFAYTQGLFFYLHHEHHLALGKASPIASPSEPPERLRPLLYIGQQKQTPPKPKKSPTPKGASSPLESQIPPAGETPAS